LFTVEMFIVDLICSIPLLIWSELHIKAYGKITGIKSMPQKHFYCVK